MDTTSQINPFFPQVHLDKVVYHFKRKETKIFHMGTEFVKDSII